MPDRALRPEIERQLIQSKPFQFSHALTGLYDLRSTAARQRDMSWLLQMGACFSLLAIGIDAMNSVAIFRAALSLRLLVAAVCLFASLILRHQRPVWLETLAFSFPVILSQVVLAAIAQIAPPHVADRYAVTALFVGVLCNVIAPLRLGQGFGLSILSACVLPGVAVLLPGSLNLYRDLDLTLGGAAPILLATAMVVRNEAQRRRSFVLVIKAELAGEELERSNAELARLSVTDALTGVANRRQFDSELARLWGLRHQRSLGVALIDVDHFKLFNDSAGHAEGDLCLQIIARTVQGCVRERPDCVARYGGEEFVVLLPGVGHVELAAISERMRYAVESLAVPHPGRNDATVTISVGAAWCPAGNKDSTPADLLRNADAALYAAKAKGRNKVIVRHVMPDDKRRF